MVAAYLRNPARSCAFNRLLMLRPPDSLGPDSPAGPAVAPLTPQPPRSYRRGARPGRPRDGRTRPGPAAARVRRSQPVRPGPGSRTGPVWLSWSPPPHTSSIAHALAGELGCLVGEDLREQARRQILAQYDVEVDELYHDLLAAEGLVEDE